MEERIYCPVNGWDCEYYNKGLCTCEDPVTCADYANYNGIVKSFSDYTEEEKIEHAIMVVLNELERSGYTAIAQKAYNSVYEDSSTLLLKHIHSLVDSIPESEARSYYIAALLTILTSSKIYWSGPVDAECTASYCTLVNAYEYIGMCIDHGVRLDVNLYMDDGSIEHVRVW